MKNKIDNPYLRKDGDHLVITEVGYQKLSEFITDPYGQVYAFNNKLSPVIIAAAMARLSRRMGDMREAILDEFILDEEDDANALIQRVVSEFGDDSVQQLVGVHVVVEDASNLLTKKLEWGRLAAYLEQSTRYIYFDKKDKKLRYRYYIPKLEPWVHSSDVGIPLEAITLRAIIARFVKTIFTKPLCNVFPRGNSDKADTKIVQEYNEYTLEDEMNLTITNFPWDQRRAEVITFLESYDETLAFNFLRENNIAYIYWIKGQRARLGETQLGIQRIYENKLVDIYKVI